LTAPELFARHVSRLQEKTEKALAEAGFDSLVVSSGTPFTFFADDRDAPFEPTPHFAHWCPLGGPHHLLHVVPGHRPRLVCHAPEDYWYEQSGVTEAFWLPQFELEEAGTLEAAWERIGRPSRAAFVGSETEQAVALGLEANPPALVARLNWNRSYKDDYEIRCLEQATVLGARAHRAAREAFASGASELEIHHAFLQAAGTTEAALPYTTIVALERNGAVLHYESKQTVRNGRVLLLDAGTQVRRYACDITRTTTSSACDPRFAAMVQAMDALEQELVPMARPGRPYLHVHLEAHRGIGQILAEHGVLKVGAEEAYETGLTHPFFPHGIGHHLGIQVHDVAGKQSDPSGTPAPPPEEHPYLRNTRMIEPGHVFTIEPGLYFIPMLLRPFRSGPRASAFDWEIIDALTPLGGIRVEDNVVVMESGPRNLTREQLPD
jgi:Xaa-Pro dipeptidase